MPMNPRAGFLRCALIAACALVVFVSGAALALAPELVRELALGDSDARLKALGTVVGASDTTALPLLQGLVDGEIQVTPDERVLRVKDDQAIDVLTGAAVTPLPERAKTSSSTTGLRREFASAIAVLRLTAPERDVRLAAAKGLQSGADEEMLPAIIKALANEQDAEIRGLLAFAQATVELGSSDKAKRVAAIRALGGSNSASTKTLLLGLLERKGTPTRSPTPTCARKPRSRCARSKGGSPPARWRDGSSAALSLGSILLLAALGLAITYGLMGVINMAHGELIMIGAYATYVVQNAFRTHLPGAFDAYLVAALPVSFLAAAVVGMAMERTVIRFLYGRPLETLLATWGISLILIQATRMLFGAQNVQVENPVWMSGGIAVFANAVLPYSRIVIIGFAAVVLTGVWLLLTRTRLGLFVRGVTQNRSMASALGVPTGRIDTLAFGLGSGIAGLAGCALSQIGNVGPDLGQSYIVDSFMVVVLGGVGQLAGTVYAGLGLGIANKFLEAWSGAVLAKIAVLVFIIVFIQKRPQGLFALKGRMADG